MKTMKLFLTAVVMMMGVFSTSVEAMPNDFYRQSITGYMGYTLFGGAHDVGSNFQGGVLFTHLYNPQWTVETKVGIIPSWTDKTGGGTGFRTLYPYEFGAAYMLKSDWAKIFPYVRSGINGDFSDYYGLNMALYVGAGFIYPTGERTFIRGDVAWGRTFSVNVGFGKSFRTFWDDVPPVPKMPTPEVKYVTNTVYLTPTPTVVYVSTDSIHASCNVVAPPYFYVFAGTPPRFTDAENHWAISSLRRVSMVGLMPTSKGKIRPTDNVLGSEMTDMVMKATYLHKLLENMVVPLQVSLEGIPSYSYTVDIKVQDKSGNDVRVLTERESHIPGTFDLVWDGTDGTSPVPSGDYKILVKVYKDGEPVHECIAMVQARSFKPVEIIGNGKTIEFSESHESDWGRKVVQNFVNLGYADPTMGQKRSTSSKPVNKIDFIVAVSKSLMQMGATRSAQVVDWSFYKDKDAIPSYAIGNLEVYVHSFGFGGVRGTSMLEPNKLISRAEAAEILNRLLNWNIQYLGVFPTSGGQVMIKKSSRELMGPQKSSKKAKAVKKTTRKKVVKKGAVPAKASTVKASKASPKKVVSKPVSVKKPTGRGSRR